MRSLRWLLLVAIAVIAAAVFGIYRAQRRAERAHQRPVPASLPSGTIGNAIDYEWAQSNSGMPAVKVKAKDSRLLDGNRMELKTVELQIYQKDGKHYDRVRSPEADFSMEDNKLYAPGEAEITLNVPAAGDSAHPLTSIKAAGINFDSKSGQAVTDKAVAFTFEGGDGTCIGASYDPQTHQLHLDRDVVLNLRGKDGKTTPMKVEGGELIYSETEALIHLSPWSRMTRDQTIINAGPSVVKLRDKKIDTIDATEAKGTDKRPGRALEYSAGTIHVEYNTQGEMEKLNGAGNAKLVSRGNGSETTMTGSTVDLFFDTGSGESELSSAVAKGDAAIESKPSNTSDTKIMRADQLDLKMKPGGKDLDRVNTHSPGTLEFLPNQPAGHRRVLKASEMDIAYGAKNEIQSFHAVNAATETYPSEAERKQKKTSLPVAYTSSKTIDAAFDEKGELKRMKQTDDFHYVDGPRKAQADSATLEKESNVMNLESHARIADESGSTAADHIELQQSTGDFDAKGHVSTTRLPDEKKATSDMLDKEEPTQGLADRVTSADRNHLMHYVGNAVLWQSSNRIQADQIDIDREKKMLTADGKVVSQFQDADKKDADKKDADKKDAGKSKDGKTKPAPAQPIFTIVKSQHMVYTDSDRQSVYSGGANLWRPTLTVKCATLKAFLNDGKSNEDSRINHAFGEGKVEIVETGPDRQRVGTSEHAEYYTEEAKVVLTGGEPKLTDSVRGNTTGEVLTYFTDDDRLLVNGTPKKQVTTHLRRKK
jgi:lipopolysaccharide export system protein LptA